MIIYFTLFGTLSIVIARSYDNCSTVANCTHQSYKRDYECNNGICEERTCYNDTKCIEDDLWYGPGYRCDMSTNNYECINDCVNNTDCTSGYLCCHSGGCYGNCVQCLIDTDCAVNEYCDPSENCQTSCNGNDTYCQVEYWYYDNMVCDSNGACVQRECYSNTDCDNKNYTNYRCDTSYFNDWKCVEKCTAISCDSWRPVCNSNGECERENCINTPSYCDFGTEICNLTAGECDEIPCESNNDCASRGWFCDDMGGYCYMDCLDYNSSYCNSVMMYGKYNINNYKCSSNGECERENCINTPSYCDFGTEICNLTAGECDEIPCESNNDCASRGWFCDDMGGYCYMDCLYYNSSYCNSVMMYGKYNINNYKCSSNGECERENCINTPSYCDFGTEICNLTAGECDEIPCESNNDCASRGWFCDDMGGYCYMDC
eukprot:299171_1